MVGKIIKIEAALMVLPLITALIYRESSAKAFLISIIIALCIGFGLSAAFKPKSQVIYAREGFIIVALAWAALSAVGALPYVISGEIPSYIDAFFETVSGFTTTGSSIVTDVTKLSHGILFWRSFAHWIGGMGVLVFVMAVVPAANDRSIHIMRAEMPGPIIGKLVPRAGDTAKILYLIYVGITVIEIILLCLGGMPLFDSLVNTFGTVGTGGLAIKPDSYASYSPYLQWVTTVFMLICGINFNLYYLILVKRFKSAIRSEELWCYLIIVLIVTAVISVDILPLYNGIGDAVRHSAFQVSSIITTTGYSTADFNYWPDISKGIMLLLIFIGGCAGSTAGGFKQSRAILLYKMIKREMRHVLHPHSVGIVKFEGKRVDDETLNGVGIYLALYVLCFCVIFLILCVEPFGFETNFTAAATCFNNVGPGFAMVGPMGSFAPFSPLSKIVLSVAMLLGRLEIYPILIAASFSTWSRKA